MARRSGSKVTATEWVPSSGLIEGVSASTSIVAIGASAFSAPAVVLRTRGQLLAQLDGNADNDLAVVFWGLILARPDQVAAGATSFADPGTDTGDYFAAGVCILNREATEFGESSVCRSEIDSKAMRKARTGNQIVLVAQSIILAGTPVVDVAIGVRMLVGT